jgi:hypothetical protein
MSVLRCPLLIAMVFGLAHSAWTETFPKTKIFDHKGKEVAVELGFDRDKQILSVKAAGKTIEEAPYTSIEKLSYERAARHRIKEGAPLAILGLGGVAVGSVVMLTKSKNHWFYVDYKPPDGTVKTLTLKLHKGEYEQALKTATEQTGKQVEMLTPVKKESAGSKK